jgi:predicted nucleic acid-binding protein
MAGSLVDLTDPTASIPRRLVLDSNIVIDWLLATGNLHSLGALASNAQVRSASLVERIRNEGAVGLVTSTGLNEVFHFVLKTAYQSELRRARSDPAVRRSDLGRHGWLGLFKAQSRLVRQIALDLDTIRALVDDNGIVFLQPDDPDPIPSGRLLDDEVVRTMERYELDSGDAAILVESRRAGINAIATADADLHRAQLDFDGSTWP